MIIQCEHCRTKFKLDDAKVKDTGVKVRCAKCRNVFKVSKDQSQLAEKPDFAAMLGHSADAAVVSAVPVAFEIDHGSEAVTTAGSDFDSSTFELDEVSDKSLSSEKETFELSNDEFTLPAVSPEEFDVSSLALDDETAFAVEQSAMGSETMDFSEIAADGIAQDTDKAMVASSSFTGMDDMVSEAPSDQSKPDLDGFMDSIESHEPAGSDVSKSTYTDEEFHLGEIDFGDELDTTTSHQINPENVEEDHNLLFVPLEEPLDKVKAADDFEPVVVPAVAAVAEDTTKVPEVAAQEELPPLSISSRRKSPSTMFMAMVGLLVAGVIALFAFFGLEKSTVVVSKPGEGGIKISLQNVKASFVKNSTVGDLLVISGEAVNNYDTPRAAIQVMGTLYSADNKVLMTKNAYAGNPISKEQLATMTAEKIEAAMSNQFGDSLANMEVAPGKAIPFVIVLSNVPAEAKQIGCDLIGSTGAAPAKK